MSEKSVIKEFLVKFGFEANTKQAKQAEEALSSLSKAVKTFVAAFVTGKAFSGASRIISEVATRFSELGTETRSLNTSAESILELGNAAALSNSNIGAVKSSLASLNKMAIEAASGFGAGAEAFWRMGIRAKDQNGKLRESSALLEEIGGRVRGMSRERGLAVLARFGIDTSLYDMLASGTGKMRKEIRELYKSAGIDATKAAKGASDFTGSMHRLKAVLGATKDAAILKLMPRIQDSIDRVRKFILRHMPSISKAIERFGNYVIRVLDSGAGSIGRFYRLGKNLVDFFKGLHISSGGASTAIMAIAGGILVLNRALNASPFMLLLAALSVIALLIDDFLAFKEGGKSLVDWGGKAGFIFKALVALIGLATAGLAAMKVAMWAFNIASWANPAGVALLKIIALMTLVAVAALLIYVYWEPIKDFFKKLWKAVWDDYTSRFRDAANRVLETIESMKKALSLMGDYLKNLFSLDFEEARKSSKEFKAETLKIKDNIKNLTGKSLKFGIQAMIPGAGALFKAIETYQDVLKGMDARGISVEGGPNYTPVGGMSHAPVNQNIEQHTEINVTGSASPEATGRAVASLQKNVNSDMARNLRPRVA